MDSAVIEARQLLNLGDSYENIELRQAYKKLARQCKPPSFLCCSCILYLSDL